MRHYNFLTDEQRDRLFMHAPEPFDFSSDKALLSNALGATLYCPAIRTELVKDIEKMAAKGASSIVICLEDSIPDNRLEEAESNLTKTLVELDKRGVKDLPLLFVRVRNAEHLERIAESNVTYLHTLTGFVLPKFGDTRKHAEKYVSVMRDINARNSYTYPMYYMPVLESPNIVHRETRKRALKDIKRVIDKSRDLILAVRIGATDMSSVYGVRRSPDFTVWDVHALASAIGDIINVFGRAKDGFVITGSVWEHFSAGERLFKPQLRASIFDDEQDIRRQLLVSGDDTFIREIQLDRVNGIQGKTIIHPSHIKLVHALSVVTHEEYADALDITSGERKEGGATSSFYRNKMNEVKPHHAWAVKTLARAKAFGVANEGIDFIDFLEASTD